MNESMLVRIGADLTGFKSGLAKAGNIASSAAKKMAIAFTAAITAVSLVGGKFEQALTETATVAGAFGKDLEALENKARELGKTTAFTATQAAEGMYDLASAGMNTRQIVDSVEHAMKLAGATGSEMTQATGLLASSMKQFGLDAEDSRRITDTYAAAITKSQLTMEKLTEAMKFAGTTGSALEWSIEQTTAAVAQFANLGLQGGMAGRNLRMAMVQLVKGTDEATAALTEMGLIFEQINPETNTFGEILTTIGEKSITTKQAVAIFGSESGLNMKKLAQAAVSGESDFAGFVDMLKESQKGVGRTAEMYARMMDTFQGQWKVMLSAMQELAISVFDLFKTQGKEVFIYLAEKINDFANVIKKNEDEIKKVLKTIGDAFYSVSSIIIDGVGLAWEAVKFTWDAVTDLWALFSAVPSGVITFFTNVADETKKATEEINNLNKAISEVEVPPQTSFQEFWNFMGQWGEDIINVFVYLGKSIGGTFGVMVSDAIATVKMIGEQFVNLGTLIWNALSFNFSGAANILANFGETNKKYVAEMETNWTAYTETIFSAWDKMMSDIKSGMNKTKELVIEDIEAIAKKNTEAALEIAAKIKVSFLEQVKAAAKAAVEKKKILDDEVKDVEDTEDAKAKAIKDAAKAAKQLAADRATAARNMLKDMGGSSRDYFKAEQTLIDAQRDAYMELYKDEANDHKVSVKDKAAIDAWYVDQVEKNNDKMLLSNGTWVDGFKLGIKDMNEATKTWAEKGKEYAEDIADSYNNAVKTIVDTWIRGEDVKVKASELAKDMIVDLAGKGATALYNAAIDQIIAVIGPYIGLGTASSSTQGDTVAAKLGYGAAYLAGAIALMAGAKHVAKEFKAQGGWIENHPMGGIIQQGSRTKDDVYLGQTPGINHWGMGGEYVINQKSTNKYFDLIKAINEDRLCNGGPCGKKYAEGGTVTDWRPVADDLQEAGLTTFLKGWYDGGIYQGIKDAVTYYIGVVMSSYGGKKWGDDLLFEKGGQIGNKNVGYGWNSIIGDVIDDTVDYFVESEVKDEASGMIGGGIYDILNWVFDFIDYTNPQWGEIFGDCYTRLTSPTKIWEDVKGTLATTIKPFVVSLLTPNDYTAYTSKAWDDWGKGFKDYYEDSWSDCLGGKDGGIFSGPESGYPVVLHGTEEVIPLNNKQSQSRAGNTININSIITIEAGATLIADENTFNDFVEKVDDRLKKLQRWGY